MSEPSQRSPFRSTAFSVSSSFSNSTWANLASFPSRISTVLPHVKKKSRSFSAVTPSGRRPTNTVRHPGGRTGFAIATSCFGLNAVAGLSGAKSILSLVPQRSWPQNFSIALSTASGSLNFTCPNLPLRSGFKDRCNISISPASANTSLSNSSPTSNAMSPTQTVWEPSTRRFWGWYLFLSTARSPRAALFLSMYAKSILIFSVPM
mmetsp:Transcript_64085/g.171498  ORF Transcript_64085/g.171498 Transcript_64085/m.171498 type:complete len:206 (-) Transcript_64085:406-1023(-)